MQDTHVPVLEALYANSSALLPLLLEDPSGYLQIISQILHAQTSPSRHVIRAHLNFIAMHFYPSVAALSNASQLTTAVYERIFFPSMLYSKPRQRTASLVWEIIESTEKTAEGSAFLSRFELLGGVLEAIHWEKAQKQSSEDGYHNTEALAKANVTLVAKIAENIVGSPSFASHLDFLLGRLSASDAHARALAYLVCRALLGYLSGEKQVDAAHKIIHAMQLESLDDMDDFMRGSVDLQVVSLCTSTSCNICSRFCAVPSRRQSEHRRGS